MFKWLESRFSDAQRKEAERFYAGVCGADNSTLDAISASVMFWAAFYKARGRDMYEMEAWITESPTFPTEIVQSIKALQKQNSTSGVPGLMVWLHSARGLVWPELRLQARLLWQELVKASAAAEELAVAACEAGGTPSIEFDRNRVPFGLEPINR